jgi:hypothetical protein
MSERLCDVEQTWSWEDLWTAHDWLDGIEEARD